MTAPARKSSGRLTRTLGLAHLHRTVPTAAALLMIATGISLAQSASDDAMQDAPNSPAQVQPDRPDRADRPRDGAQRPPHRETRRERPEGAQGRDGREGRGGPGAPGGPGRDAQRGPERQPGDALRMLFRDVNLTDDQQAQVRQIVRDATTPMQEYMAQHAAELRQARDAMMQARENRDRDAAQAATETMKALRDAGPKVDRDALAAAVRELLNDSQREVFDANLAEAKQRREQMEQRREAGPDGQRSERRERPQRGERGERGERPDRPSRPQGTPPAAPDQLDL